MCHWMGINSLLFSESNKISTAWILLFLDSIVLWYDINSFHVLLFMKKEIEQVFCICIQLNYHSFVGFAFTWNFWKVLFTQVYGIYLLLDDSSCMWTD